MRFANLNIHQDDVRSPQSRRVCVSFIVRWRQKRRVAHKVQTFKSITDRRDGKVHLLDETNGYLLVDLV